jgi:short-subunit dehydrogenase
MDLHNKTVLLTGAAGGIGASFAETLASGGANLILVGRSLTALATLLESLPGSGHRAVPADLGTAEGRLSVVNACTDGIDVLINNAGVNHFGLLTNQTDEQIRMMFELNSVAPILLIKGLLPRLVERESIIVNVGSGFGSIGFAGYCGYSASKFALRGFSQALRRELADTSVNVVYLAPRATSTSMNPAHIIAMNSELGNAIDKPQRVSRALMGLLAKPRGTRFLGWPERFFIKLNSLFPGIVDRSLGGTLPVIQRYAVAAESKGS